MTVRTDRNIEHDRYMATVEANREMARQASQPLRRLAGVVQVPHKNPTEIMRRLGTPMTHQELERRLGKLCPFLRFEEHPENPLRRLRAKFEVLPSWMTEKRLCYLITPEGEKKYLFAFEKGLMPEWSVLGLKRVEFWDGKTTHISGKDLPKHKDDPRPGTIRADVPWREEVRGWRTVLLRLIHMGLTTLTEVENEFGRPDVWSWAVKTGRVDDICPY